jgi:hypothetical protein
MDPTQFQLQAVFTTEATALIDQGLSAHEAYTRLAGTSYVTGDFEAGVAEKIGRLRGVLTAERAAESQRNMGLQIPDSPEGLK